MESEKSHDLLSARWSPRKARCVIRLHCKDLTNGGTLLLNTVQRQKTSTISYQAAKQEVDRGKFFLHPPFCYFRSSRMEWCPPTLGGLSILPSLFILMLILSRNTLTNTLLCLVKLACKICLFPY